MRSTQLGFVPKSMAGSLKNHNCPDRHQNYLEALNSQRNDVMHRPCGIYAGLS
jgi:hypothetical protein